MSEERAQYGEAGEAKHTPGPWRYDAEGLAIMSWDGVQVVDLLGAMEGEDATADAHLIAAAPDLLNIALRVVGALEDLEDDPLPRYRTRWHDLRDDARAAINHAAPAAQTTEADHDGR